MSEDKFTVSASASAMPAMVTAKDLEELLQTMEEHPVTDQIPQQYLESIGKIITQWALQEWLLAGIICLLLDISRKDARIAIGNPRTGDTLQRIKQLCRVKDIPVPSTLPTPAPLEQGERARDLLSHGIWLNNKKTGKLCIQDTSGSWDLPKQEQVSKRLYPEAKDIDQGWFEDQLNNMSATIEATGKAYRELESWLATSHGTGA